MPVTASSSIQRQPFQQMLGVELPARQEKPPAPRPALGPPAPKLDVRKLSFGLLETLCPPELVDRVIKEAGREGERNRLLPPRVVVYALLLMCLSGTMGYGRLMRVSTDTRISRWADNWPLGPRTPEILVGGQLGPWWRQASGTTPLPSVASASRSDGPSVTMR